VERIFLIMMNVLFAREVHNQKNGVKNCQKKKVKLF